MLPAFWKSSAYPRPFEIQIERAGHARAGRASASAARRRSSASRGRRSAHVDDAILQRERIAGRRRRPRTRRSGAGSSRPRARSSPAACRRRAGCRLRGSAWRRTRGAPVAASATPRCRTSSVDVICRPRATASGVSRALSVSVRPSQYACVVASPPARQGRITRLRIADCGLRIADSGRIADSPRRRRPRRSRRRRRAAAASIQGAARRGRAGGAGVHRRRVRIARRPRQLAREIAGVLPALVGILRQGGEDDALDGRRRLRLQRAHRRRVLGEDRGDEAGLAAFGERALSGDHLVDDQAERVDVGARVDRAARRAVPATCRRSCRRASLRG